MLKEIESGLEAALQQQALESRAGGGRKRIFLRHYFIVRLADIWTEMDKKIVRSRKSDFVSFSDVIFETVGWPTDGIFDAVIEALNEWDH
jgi:hypothetical protein